MERTGANDGGLLNRDRGFANSDPSPAECARCAIAMLIHSDSRRGRLRPPFATKSRAQARQSWTENLNLSLTSTMNELLIGFVFGSAGFGPPAPGATWACMVREMRALVA